MTDSLNGYLDAACFAAQAAGATLRGWFSRQPTISLKSERDPVTQADIEAEQAILGRLQSRFPDHHFLCEESGDLPSGQPYRWIIDPLDGTTNFIHQLPHFAVSIALQIHETTVLGVVYQPMLDELYTALRGHGALLNGQPLRVSRVPTLADALLGTGFSARVELRHKQEQVLSRVLARCGAVREPGSAALGLCAVARGQYEGYWELGLDPWDIAAGALIVSEAGGTVSDPTGGAVEFHVGDILASNTKIHQLWLKAVAAPPEHPSGRA